MHTGNNNKNEKVAQQPMVARRTITSLPVRSPQATWEEASHLILALLGVRDRDIDAVQESLQRLRPLVEHLITMHRLCEEAITFECGDLRLQIAFRYGGDRSEDDLTLPPLEVLDPLPADAPLTLTVFSNQELTDPHFEALLEDLNADGPLAVTVQVPQSADSADCTDDGDVDTGPENGNENERDFEDEGDDDGRDDEGAHNDHRERRRPFDDVGRK